MKKFQLIEKGKFKSAIKEYLNNLCISGRGNFYRCKDFISSIESFSLESKEFERGTTSSGPHQTEAMELEPLRHS